MVMPPGYDLDLDELVAKAIRHGTPDRAYSTGSHLHPQPLTVMACARHRLDLLEKLIQAEAQTSLPRALGYAVWCNASDCIHLLLNSGVRPEGNDIFQALRHGRNDLVFLLLEHNPALLYAEVSGTNTLLHLVMLSLDIATAGRLLERGAEVNARNANKETPLFFLVQNHLLPSMERLALIELLLSHGADPNAADNHGMTALMWVTSRGDQHAIKQLLEAGADSTLVNNEGHCAWDYAKRKYDTDLMRDLLGS
jgi:uncharacterized protein